MKHKPIIELVDGYKPSHSCREHILNDLPSVFVNVDGIPTIVVDCITVSEYRLEQLPSNIPRLTNDEALAIAAYSCESESGDKKNNIYYALNEVLRENDPKKVEKLLPFLSYLMSGITKLPPVKATVYRGIPNTSMGMIKEKYQDGLNIHWSGFTSTTNNIERAKRFADAGGIIFRIKIYTGRNIEHYSYVSLEEEVLLFPNCKLLVTASVHPEGEDGFYDVDLVEPQESTFVF